MTDEEQKNLPVVREYMEIAYDPKRASAAVAHRCAPDNRFIAPSAFPGVHTLEEYADDHAVVMKSLDDRHFVSSDVFFAAGDRVCLKDWNKLQMCGSSSAGRPRSA